MMKKTDKKFHIEDPDYSRGYNGQGPNILSEPVPNFSSRPGDHLLQPPVDNNTIIIFAGDLQTLKAISLS